MGICPSCCSTRTIRCSSDSFWSSLRTTMVETGAHQGGNIGSTELCTGWSTHAIPGWWHSVVLHTRLWECSAFCYWVSTILGGSVGSGRKRKERKSCQEMKHTNHTVRSIRFICCLSWFRFASYCLWTAQGLRTWWWRCVSATRMVDVDFAISSVSHWLMRSVTPSCSLQWTRWCRCLLLLGLKEFAWRLSQTERDKTKRNAMIMGFD